MSFIKTFSLNSLPIELTNIILEFTGYHKKRNGKYIKQITEANIKAIKDKMQIMPKITRGYVKLKLPSSDKNTKTNETTTIILFGPYCSYKNIGGRL